MNRLIMLFLTVIIIAVAGCGKDDKKPLTDNKQTKDNNVSSADNDKSKNGLNHTIKDDVTDLLKDVNEYQFKGNPDYDNAKMLYLLNVGGINMINSYLILDAPDGKVKDFAKKMLKDHEGEINELEVYIDANKPNTTAGDNTDYAYKKNALTIINKLKVMQISDANANKLFLTHLIPHHQTGVELLTYYLPLSKDNKIKKISEKAIKDYKEEIEEMQKLLSES